MNDYREKFIEAEKQATQLVAQLERLKEEAQSYQEASETLEGTREQLGDLINKTVSLGQAQQELIDVLGEIGTEEIIQVINQSKDKLQERLTGIDEDLISQKKLISEGINLQNSLHSQANALIDEQTQVLKNKMIDGFDSSREDIRSLEHQLKTQHQDWEEVQDQRALAERRFQLTLYVCAGLVVVVGILVLIMNI